MELWNEPLLCVLILIICSGVQHKPGFINVFQRPIIIINQNSSDAALPHMFRSNAFDSSSVYLSFPSSSIVWLIHTIIEQCVKLRLNK